MIAVAKRAGESRRDRGRERGKDDRGERPRGPRRPPRRDMDDKRRQAKHDGMPSEQKYGDRSGKGLNTQLADQLAELKKRFGG